MGKKIILVDDSRTARQQVTQALADDGYELVEAVDGADGLAKVAEHPDAALLIVDVNMPKMSGLEMVSSLRASANETPVLMLTTESQPELVQQARTLGAKGWMVKPFKPELLRSAVAKLVGFTGSTT